LAKRDTPETSYAFCGAVAIHQELDNLGYRTKPALSTINRVLKRNGLIAKQDKDAKKKSSKKYYPEIKARHPGHLHQLDLVTPRYIKGFGVIISVNRIDVYTAQANLEQYQSKGANSIISFIIDDWKTFGIPRYLQLDNEASFRGSLYHSRSFGKLSRFCLNFGVELVFIPFNEPWRNAHIESFNSRFDKMLWQPKIFKDLEHVRSESKKFRDKHNNYQEYRKNNFSKQKPKSYATRYLPESFTFDSSQDLPLTRGRLHFVRLIAENGNINILNEDFYVDKNLSFEYVWAIISTKDLNMKIWYQATKGAPKELLKTVPYKLREPVKNRIPISNFS
jgi:putative transposase